MTRKWHLYDAVTHEKTNVRKIYINQEESLILIFLLLAHAQTFDRCVGQRSRSPSANQKLKRIAASGNEIGFSSTKHFYNEKRVIHVEDEKFRLPVDVCGSEALYCYHWKPGKVASDNTAVLTLKSGPGCSKPG